MARGAGLLTLFFLVLLCALVASQSYHDGSEYSLSELTVLLPYTSARARVKYQLHARATAHNHGCFKFKAMNTDIVVVDPVYKEEDPKGCTRSAFISVAATLSGLSRVSTFVVAEDISSGRVLRCEVFVAPIAALTVHTTTKSVYRDEFEMLQIFATDPEGNTFSTLRGVEFEWHVSNNELAESNNKVNGRDILKIVPFKGSQQEVDPLIMMMELQNLQTDVILVQGISIGRALVSVQLMDAQYTTEARRASVSILVFESFMVTPAQTLYVTVGTQVFYHLWNVHQQQMSRVSMPNPLFIWSTSNNTVAKVDDKGDALALELGYTAVIVCAGNFRENEARGAIQVVEPGKLTVSIEQKGHPPVFADEYYLVVGREYIMKVYLFDKHDHPIYYNGTIIFEVSIPSQEHYVNMQTQSQSRNTSHFVTKSVGHSQFTISINSLKNAVTGYSIPLLSILAKTLSVFITEPIVLGCAKVYLPWATGVGGLPHFQLKAVGGSNETNWFTTEKDIVAVDSRGYLTGISIGSTNIVVEDRNNPLNRDKTNVIVGHVPPISLRASSNEVLVGGTITIRVGMWDWTGLAREGGPYDCFSCESGSITWEETGAAFFVDSASNIASDGEAVRGQCAVSVFTASHAGSSVVHVTYVDDIIHAEISIFAYEPLRVVEPQFSLVTLGSSTEYEFAGGPTPWYQDNSLHYLTATLDEVQAVQTSRNTLRISCRSHGDFNITVTAGNRATESNPRPITSFVIVPFRCHPVHLVRLVPPDLTKLDSRCMSKEDTSTSTLGVYRFPNYYPIPFGYELRDKQDKLFTNSSSVQLDWISENKTVATFVRTANKMNKDAKVSLNTEKNNGTTVVRVLVTGYKSDHLKEANVLSSNIPTIKQGDVEHKIKLVLFEKLSLSSFPQSPLYVDSRVFATVAVHGGSGIFSFNIQNTSVAKLAYDGDSKDVKVYPVSQGNAEVVVGDLCTPEYDQVTELLHFSGTHNLLVHGTDKVAVNNTVKFTVQPTDVYGTVFHPSQYPTH